MSGPSRPVSVRALGFELKKEEIKNIFEELDKDLNQEVTLEEFVKMMTPRMVRRIKERMEGGTEREMAVEARR